MQASKQAFLALVLVLAGGASLPVLSPTFAQEKPGSSEIVRGGMLDASDPAKLVAFMQTLGYQAESSKDSLGDPAIHGRISSTNYQIRFYECEDGVFCNSIQFLVDTPVWPGLTLQELNAFNSRWRYVRVSAIDTVVRLQMDVNLDGGVTAGNIEDTLDIWRRLLETFEVEFITPNKPPELPVDTTGQ